jgi:hypothetical protein
MGEDGQMSMVSGYSIGRTGEFAFTTRDIVPGPRCAFDLEIPEAEFSSAPILFDTHIVGSKKCDRHFTLKDHSPIPGPSWRVGKKTFIAPLYDWSDKDVINALAELGVDYEKPSEELDTGNIPMCSKCLTSRGEDVLCPKTNVMISGIEWSPEGNLAAWRQVNGIS